ncbi:stress-induced protein [Sorangium cellulosum]|uniref:Stress-induced protein n=1 Tax=Sorangium cellulosum TaxID=56 RepID=A0A2L0EVN4_SORCE|nr:KGG domain-containing protein [Sorangium cellulosum]AUX43319.1 stress-induced protein [Sorangium cellulosum]
MGQSSESKRGFAAMNAEQQRQIASQGGKAAHEKGTAHEFTSEEARAAGRKGGEAVSQNREHMAQIGRKGAEARSHSAANGSRRSRSHEQHARADEQPQGS